MDKSDKNMYISAIGSAPCRKTVCMAFAPRTHGLRVSYHFPPISVVLSGKFLLTT